MEEKQENKENRLEELSLEEAFARLDQIIEKLQNRETPLEEAFTLYQEGAALLKVCTDKIDLVEKKVLVLSQDGSVSELE